MKAQPSVKGSRSRRWATCDRQLKLGKGSIQQGTAGVGKVQHAKGS